MRPHPLVTSTPSPDLPTHPHYEGDTLIWPFPPSHPHKPSSHPHLPSLLQLQGISHENELTVLFHAAQALKWLILGIILIILWCNKSIMLYCSIEV